MATTINKPKLASAGDFALDTEKAAEVLSLIKGSTSIELKVMLPYDNRGLLRKLGFDPVDAEPRQTYFFDTPKFELNKAGLFVRARRSPHGRGDTTVKLRPVDPANLDRKLFRETDFKVEIDVMHGGYVCSASATGRCSSEEVYDASEGRVPLKSIFTDHQRDFYKSNAPHGIKLKDLMPIGPAFLLRLKCVPKDFDRPMTVELWLYPDGSRILELSTKGEPHEAFQLGAQFRTFLGNANLMRERDARTKTAQTLQVFTLHGEKTGRPAVV